jgi:two-component system, NtrC family, response regulator AtoC
MENNSKHRLLIVEDEPVYAELIKYKMGLNPDIHTSIYNSGQELLKKLPFSNCVITLDINLPDTNGLVLLKTLKQKMPDCPVIILSGQDKIETAIECLNSGAFDYIIKDIHALDKLWHSVHRAIEQLSLKSEIHSLKKTIENHQKSRLPIIGSSSAMQPVYEIIEKAAGSSINVIIAGETGTGKELVAKAIHRLSDRKNKPFIAVNVAAFPKDLIESELFGYEKGAFTGALQNKPGKLEEANGGYLFLDEVSEMDISMQAKLLRALQEMEISRLGSNKTIPLNFRLIAASNKNLKEEVNSGRFREDLYYRLLGLKIELPPLRKRGGDIVLLADYFIEKFAGINLLKSKKLSDAALKKLISHPFPGNVRELKAIVETALVISNSEYINEQDIIIEKTEQNQLPEDDTITMEEFQQKIIVSRLKKHKGNVVKTANSLKIGKSTIYKMLQEGKINPDLL